jgi:predicted SnoaL-like aldol condensation-catalyzing enzyme
MGQRTSADPIRLAAMEGCQLARMKLSLDGSTRRTGRNPDCREQYEYGLSGVPPSGPLIIRRVSALCACNALRLTIVDDTLVDGHMDKLAGYYDGHRDLQYNPQSAHGLSGLGASRQAMAARGVTLQYNHIHQALGEGNFVLTASGGTFAGKHSAFYDLFRVEGGKIAEHWDVIQTIPARAGWKNTNGKFWRLSNKSIWCIEGFRRE